MTPTLQTPRLVLLETCHVRASSILGPTRCIYVNAWDRRDPAPCLITASLLLAATRDGEWVLSHVLIADEERRRGYATELVAFYEERLGRLGACWVTEGGEKFAAAYVDRFGPRPHWQIGKDPAIERLLERMGVTS